MQRVAVFGLWAALMLVGCGSAKKASEKVEQSGMAEQQAAQPAMDAGMSPLQVGLRMVNARAKGESQCVSPMSLMMALDMAREGARGATRRELDAFLSNPLVLANRALGRNAGDDRTLLAANALWSDAGKPLSAQYVGTLKEQHGATARELQLRLKPALSADIINGWVKENTKGLIEKLVEAGDIAQASMVLTNALYFRGEWARPFPKSSTHKAKFHATSGDYDVQLMQQEGQFRYAENAQMQMVELEYKDLDYRMLVVLPRTSARETNWGAIDAGALSELYSKMEYDQVKIFLPRYDRKSTMHLIPSLSQLGLGKCFSDAADFSGMGKEFAGERIGDVIQAVRFTVDEQKTEAAAATGIVMMRASLPPEAIPFRADRPFLYILYHKTLDNAVFVGVLDE